MVFAIYYKNVTVVAHPAGFEPTAYRLGVPKSVRLWHPLIPLECLILLDF